VNKNKEIFYLIAIVSSLILIVTQLTSSWFTWKSDDEHQIIFGINGLDITSTNIDINATIYPTKDKNNGIKEEFTIKQNNKIATPVCGDFTLTLTKLPNELKHESFIYELYNDEQLIGEGNFADKNQNDVITIASSQTITTNTQKYKLYIWIDGVNYNNPIAMNDKEFSFTLNINASQQQVACRPSQYVDIMSIYDSTGTVEDKLHIGDFVNYDAGRWTTEEIQELQNQSIVINNSLDLPTESYQFGGFTVDSDRNGTVKSSVFNGLGIVEYIRNAEDNNPLTGWRIFDIDTNNSTITLISAGNPESFYQNTEDNAGYITEYILSGNINSAWTPTNIDNYTIRSWSKYINQNQYAQNAYILSKSQLQAWYKKHISVTGDLWTQANFKKIYNYERLHNIVDNYSFWWLSTARSDAGPLFVQGDTGRRLRGANGVALGIRIMIELSPEAIFYFKPTDTIEITSEAHLNEAYGGNQVYNVWNFG